MRKLSMLILTGLLAAPFVSAQQAVAPEMPAFEIAEETEVAVAAAPAPVEVAPAPVAEVAPAPKPAPAKKRARRSSRRRKAAANANLTGTVAPEAKKALDAQAEVSVSPAKAPVAKGQTGNATLEADIAVATANTDNTPGEGAVAPREPVAENAQPVEAPRVVFNPITRRDPMLSPDDFLILQYREQQRLAAERAARERAEAEERRIRAEAERLRQLELARLKDPTREVRHRIHIGGIIGKEVFIGSKVYTIGNRVLGAKIVEVRPDEVVFSYKGHKFVRRMK